MHHRLVLGTLALAACSRSPGAPPAPPAAVDAGPRPDAATRLPAVDAAGGLAITAIEPDAAAPRGAPGGARVIGGARFVDRDGPGALHLLETRAYQGTSILLQARLTRGADEREVRVVNDRADACAARNLTGFAPPAVSVTDLDHDGAAELGFGYLVGCAGARVVAKQLVLIGEQKFIIRGSTADGGVPEPAAAAWPPAALGVATAAFRDNAGALDVVDDSATASAAIYTADSDVERVTGGAGDRTWSYPVLAMIGPAQAAQLTLRMRRIVDPPGRRAAGARAARCDLGLVTADVVSLACAITAADTRHATLAAWRTGDRADVTAAELGLTPAAGCGVALTAAGVAWRALRPDAACPGDTAWAALTPISPRATALVARMRAP
ncbi:MAG: hypothetical protein IPH44_05075 [Myxococcales bacterium]|nr:hypothetical protein [Myxococcales bacterium]